MTSNARTAASTASSYWAVVAWNVDPAGSSGRAGFATTSGSSRLDPSSGEVDRMRRRGRAGRSHRSTPGALGIGAVVDAPMLPVAHRGPVHGACLSARPTPGATPAAASIEGRPSVRPSILRLTRFDAAGAGFDTALRDRLAPVIGDVPGLHAVIGGRMGPGQDGPRLVATVWTSREAMEAAIGAGSMIPASDPAVVPGSSGGPTDVLPIALQLDAAVDARIALIRVVRGVTRPGELDAYLDDARVGRHGRPGQRRRAARVLPRHRPAGPLRDPVPVGRLVARRGRDRRRRPRTSSGPGTRSASRAGRPSTTRWCRASRSSAAKG